ncbi:hybrid sensor histidine kinase/response regulator transcription factor [Pseudozobellia thermophila]|uniref:histidine kinase n=1 Tax=Pseudozobellia thermophila TaxID=192903 RepID=A0A1M6FTZ9_9FLAO|nr:hybrid sensor histidine kinase/response regulator transcription factor [Pseudozobellia thermophila]SHJ01172.1 Signal transduction histidine kinase [Pseudozobellia thermophila]
MRNLQLVYLAIFSTLCWHIRAQEVAEKLDFYTIKDGISQVGIHTISQDDKGFIWIGTHGSGIYRYDGMDYVSYRPKAHNHKTLTSSFVYCTYLDHENRLWVGTNVGLALYDRQKDEFTHIPLRSTRGENLGNVGIISLQGDAKGNLYMGTSEQGIFLMHLDSFKIEKLPFNNPNPDKFLAVNDIRILEHGVLYAASSKGILEIDPKTKQVDYALFRNGDDAMTITAPMQSLFVDSENAIWGGSIFDGVYKIQPPTERQMPSVQNYRFTSNNIFSIIESPYGSILCGTENDGLYSLDKNGAVEHHYLFDKNDENSILSNSVWSLYRDKDERIWMGYYNRGVVVHDKFYNKFRKIQSLYNKDNSLQISSVTSIVGDNEDRLWIAMDGGGIDILDRATDTFTHINTGSTSYYKGLTSDYIQSLFIDSRQNIWVGSWDKGLFFLKKGGKSFIPYKFPVVHERKGSSAVMTFAEDTKGTVWIGTFNQGLYSYRLPDDGNYRFDASSFTSHDLAGSYINKIVVDPLDRVWVATTNGLIKVVRHQDDTFENLLMNGFLATDETPGYNHYDIVSMYADTKDHLWLGTRGLGLLEFDISKNRTTWHNLSSGLHMLNVNGIIEDAQGNLWLDGDTGVIKFDTESKEHINYTKRDGLVSSHYNNNAVYKDREDRLYFGGNQGIDYFDPNKIYVLNTPPKVYLKNLKVFNKNIDPADNGSTLDKVLSQTDSIVLTNKQSVFTIDYSGINFTRPEENRYAYYLEGYERDWNYVDKDRSATYTNLDAGDYVFKVKAANNDGVWSQAPVSLHIKVLPPWWKSNWAILGYALLVLLFLYLIRNFEKKRIIDRQQVEIERQKRLREEELHKERIQFFTNVAHEFSSPLTLILNPIRDILNEEVDKASYRLKVKYLTIYKNTERLIRLINELLDFSKLESNKQKVRAKRLNLVPFVKAIADHFNEEAYSNHIDLKLDFDEEVLGLWADEGMLEKIIFNLLSNAFKVTPQGGTIGVEVRQNGAYVEFRVSDTGPGLEEGELKKLFERFYQVDSLKNSYYNGAGIGLELVHSFVRLHKGRVDVESTRGKGTVFTVLLPSGNKHFSDSELVDEGGKLASVKPALTKIGPVQEAEFPESNRRLDKTLLIVEDDAELRNYLKAEFKKDYKILVAKNGNEGLGLALEVLPDVIITDVVMPEKDGYELCEAVRTDIRTSHIPIMMLTAKTQEDHRISGIGKGADVYLAKPFDMKLVRLHLNQLIHSREVIYKKYFKSMGEMPDNASITSLDKAFVERAIDYIHKNIANTNLGVESLAGHLHLSRSQLYRKIKALTNQTANEFIRNQRLQMARKLIESGNTDLADICTKVGFSSTTYFSQRFKEYFGMLPTEVKEKKT